MPDLDALHKRFQSKGLVILALSDEEEKIVSPFIATEQKVSYPVLLDPGGKVAELFHVDGIPKTFIYGRDGKLDISGLGGSYGVERLTYYKMLPEMGPPETTSWEYPMGDNSWQVEFAEFLDDIRLGRQPAAGLRDAVAALEIIDKIYRMSGYDHNA